MSDQLIKDISLFTYFLKKLFWRSVNHVMAQSRDVHGLNSHAVMGNTCRCPEPEGWMQLLRCHSLVKQLRAFSCCHVGVLNSDCEITEKHKQLVTLSASRGQGQRSFCSCRYRPLMVIRESAAPRRLHFLTLKLMSIFSTVDG